MLNKRLFEKPLEVSAAGKDLYDTNRPIEGGVERALDQMKPRKMRKTRYYKSITLLNINMTWAQNKNNTFL